jgi:hypothetical protein
MAPQGTKTSTKALKAGNTLQKTSGDVKVKDNNIPDFKKITEDLEDLLDFIINKHNLTNETSDDEYTIASAETYNSIKEKIPRCIFTAIKNAKYDISVFPELIKDNLLIIAAEYWSPECCANDVEDHIFYLKNKRRNSQEFKRSYDPIDNIVSGI